MKNKFGRGGGGGGLVNLFDKLAMNPNLKKKMKGVGGCRKVRNFFFDTMAKNPDIKKKTVYFSFFLGVGGGGRGGWVSGVGGCILTQNPHL